jgi:hypothetical protein
MLLDAPIRNFSEDCIARGIDILVQVLPNERLRIDWIENRSGEKGLGRKVIEELFDLADDNDCDVELSVLMGEPRLCAYYMSMGFEYEGEDEENCPVYCRRAHTPVASAAMAPA